MLRDISVRIHVCAALWCSLLFVQAAPTADRRSLQVENKTQTAATSGEGAHAVVVELFTSEGCSSCPPADALLVKLSEQQAKDGSQLILMGEHVDYWNYIGWTDRFSSKQFSERQSEYASALHAQVFTPQMVIDGQDPFVGNNAADVNARIAAAAKKPKPAQVALGWEGNG